MMTSRMRVKTLAALALSLACACAFGQADEKKESPKQDAIEVFVKEEAYVLSVPSSNLLVSIPRGKLARVPDPAGRPANPRYFMFADRGFAVSGWIEPEQAFPGIAKFWQDEAESRSKRGLREPQNIEIRKISKWDAVFYDMPISGGTNSNIRAHWVEAGTWIDLQLSVTTSRKSSEVRPELEAFLNAIVVKDRRQ